MREEFIVKKHNIARNIPRKKTALLVIPLFAAVAYGFYYVGNNIFHDNMYSLYCFLGISVFFFTVMAIARSFLREGGYEADESSVILRCRNKAMRIEYRDIMGINWGIIGFKEGRYAPYYEERLVIATVNGTYYIDAAVQLDHKTITTDPTCFEKNKIDTTLSKLKDYITFNMTQGLSSGLTGFMPSLKVL